MLSRRDSLLSISVLLTTILGILDQNIVASAAWPIVKSLDRVHGLNTLPWLITAYALAAMVTLPLYGKLCDLYGTKQVYLFAIAIFVGGSALCGLAQNMGELIAFRAIQGVGGGGLMTVPLLVILEILPGRGSGAGIGGVMVGLGLVTGPLVGGVLADHLSWRWIFYINLPLGAVAWFIALRCMDRRPRHAKPSIDFLGAGFIGGAAVSLLLVGEWGGKDYAWSSATILGLAVTGAVLLVAFVLREGLWDRVRAPEPILPLSLFRNGVFRVASPHQFISGMVTAGAVIFILLYLQAVQGAKSTQAGLHLLPMALGMMVSSLVVFRLLAKPGRFRMVLISGMTVVMIAMLLLSTLGTNTSLWVVNLYLFLLGFGLGQVLGLPLFAVKMAVPDEHSGAAVTSIRFSQTLGTAAGSALLGTVLARVYTSHLPANIKAGGPGGQPDANLIQSLPAGTREIVLNALVSATDAVFRTAAVIAAVAIVLTFFLREPHTTKPDDVPPDSGHDREPALAA
jgi:EmrB/QacA subfamily drug resistance transporter